MSKDHPNENKGYLFRTCYGKGVSYHHLAETQKQSEEWESFISRKKRIQEMPCLEAVAWGSWRRATQKSGILQDWLGVHR